MSAFPDRTFYWRQRYNLPSVIAESFKKASGSPENIEIIKVKGASHYRGWTDLWKKDKAFLKNPCNLRCNKV